MTPVVSFDHQKKSPEKSRDETKVTQPSSPPSRESQSKVVAVIPCFNTEQFIGNVVAKAKEYVDQVIVVDDGSSDSTAEKAKIAGAQVISYEKNRGKGAAMGIAAGQVRDTDIIVFLDGDGQHDLEDIPKIVAPILEAKADLVIGSRYLTESRAPSKPFTRRLSSKFASFILSVIISFFLPLATLFSSRIKWTKITDCTSGFRAIRKENWQKLALTSLGFEIETEMIYEAAKNGLAIREVPISCHWNNGFSHLSVLRDGLKTLKLLVRKLASETRRK